ncbi:MAG: neutral/alkaline non-lysosomal ceramidase N-terminal domain-containing protein [Myxococcota bacterium]|nr:neutral/alkaline non-lysosomal ceramidase N-terminal domain-containing protein [Myxococcota bacterium]
MSFRGILVALLLVGGGCDDGVMDDPDTGVEPPPVDAGPPEPVSVDHCTFEPVPGTARAGGAVESGALSAGVAEAFLDVPLGASLAAYTSRSDGVGAEGFLPAPDERRTDLAGSFAPSVGIETAPKVRVLALSAGGETVLIMKVDLASSYQGFVYDVEAELGPEYAGKVIIASSHSHSSFGNYSGHSALAVGFGRFRSTVYRTLIDQMVAAARAAVDAMQPAQIGFAYDPTFDEDDQVNRDRRGENDELAGGREDDHHLFVVRVDDMEGAPMALLPVFGIHGTMQGGGNALISTDSIGGIERVLEESFDSEVLVMHLQGAAGDVSPAGTGAIDCSGEEVCADFARQETVGVYALEEIRAAWEAAGESMRAEVPIEMVTRQVPLGPDWTTFTIRDGALEYAPWDGRTPADGVVFDEEGNLVSPIDEFNAPYGAALCGGGDIGLRLPRSALPGTDTLDDLSYHNCNRIELVDRIIEVTVDVELDDPPICDTTQTTVSALRIGDWMMGTLPGEPTTLLVNHLRTLSPVPAEQTIVVGYAQDHGGYLLRPEDWIANGYEPSITFWGPLEGEYVAEQTAAMMALAATDDREDAAADGVDRVATPTIVDEITLDTTSADVGSVPGALPDYMLTRLLRPVTQAQPATQVERLRSVHFTFIGDDPIRGTPRVFLQREVGGAFEDVVRRSGRPVMDADVILTWTPDPIMRVAGTERTHYYTVEFQAATPMGFPGLDGLADRRGLPAGAYRFRVEGPGFELTSDPFEVVPATLSETHEAAGADLRVTVGVESTDGYRLLDLSARSNRFVPIREEEVTVALDGVPLPGPITTDAEGALVVPAGASATTVTVTDRFGNTVDITP